MSAASASEIATKHRLGKLPSATALAADIGGAVAAQGFTELPIAIAHAERAGALPVHDLVLVSNDTAFDA